MRTWDWIFHDSHETYYRSPFGAVPCNTLVTLRITVKSDVKPTSVILRHCEHELETQDLEMQLVEELPGERVFQAELQIPSTPGLVWYYFAINLEGTVFYYGNNHQRLGGKGTIQGQVPPSYQVTVFSLEHSAPQWYQEGIIYQIFMDRFFNGTEDGSVLNPKKESLIHGRWDDTPFYVRNPGDNSIQRWNFFGGNIMGVIKKLPYLKDLGITIIYFNPLFQAPSNHKYDTGDYKKIDEMFGTNEDFRLLCERAREYGINIILDGVFSHTGSDSIYFNKEGNYESLGAYQSPESPYYSWYRFFDYPYTYESWWGIGTLPNVNEMDPSYITFIMDDEESVIKYWMKLGVKGWRLDVADELPDEFIKHLRKTMDQLDSQGVLIGEVWEDASNKVSYGKTREYLWGTELDSVMNYPFRRILIDFILGRKDAGETHRQLMSLYENYPAPHFYSNMNLIGSHDVPRILTILGESGPEGKLSEREKEKIKLSPTWLRLGIDRLKILSLIQMTFPGVPCIYYGDEAGMEGFSDPFNRGPYPWGKEDGEILAWYKKIIGLRSAYEIFTKGAWTLLIAQDDVYGYLRSSQGNIDVAAVVVNRNQYNEAHVSLRLGQGKSGKWLDVLNDSREYLVDNGLLVLNLLPLEGKVLIPGES